MATGGESRIAVEAATLPPFAVRRSSRARRIRLSVTVHDGLVVTLPVGIPLAEAERAVRDRAEWARRHLAATAQRRDALAAHPEDLLPDAVELAVFGETWSLALRESPATGVRARHDGAALVLTGDVDDAAACLDALRRWRDRTARERLPHLLAEVSSACGIGYARVTVRGQRTRWGSCSSRGSISLNRNLVFLPEHLVRYVMLHELVHVREPNHSLRFWSLLATLHPGAGSARVEMRDAARYVPAWAEGRDRKPHPPQRRLDPRRAVRREDEAAGSNPE